MLDRLLLPSRVPSPRSGRGRPGASASLSLLLLVPYVFGIRISILVGSRYSASRAYGKRASVTSHGMSAALEPNELHNLQFKLP
jgi:hypothetical protein